MKQSLKLLTGVGVGVLLAQNPLNVSAEAGMYQVQRGDSLSMIASQYNTSADELARINNIKDQNKIYPGQMLKLDTSQPNNNSGNQSSSIIDQFKKEGRFPIERQYYRISSTFGQRTHPITGQETSFHEGIDLSAAGINRTNVYSVLPGRVTHSGNTNNGYGNYVVIQHDGFTTLYAHMAETPNVRSGQQVLAGERIGLVGTTGQSTGPHLHLEINVQGKKIDPKPYLDTISQSVTPNSSSSQPNHTGGNSTPVTNSAYTIQAGDSLWKISSKFNLSVKDIKELNNLRSDLIFVGQTLNVSRTNNAPNHTPNNSPVNKPTATYTVKRGDNLWRIATGSSQTVKQLKELNNLSSDVIYVGQTLRLS